MVCAAETGFSVLRQLDEDKNTAVLTKTAGVDPDCLLRLLEDDQKSKSSIRTVKILQVTLITVKYCGQSIKFCGHAIHL